MDVSLKRILWATDGSREAELAGRAAADLSEKAGAELHVVHVWTDAPPPTHPGMVFDDYSRMAEQEAGRLLRQQAWNARVAGGRVAGEHLREGKPAQEITALAGKMDADLVVVGSRGAGWVRHLITGTVSESVVRRAPCPVLVVRGGEEAWPAQRIVVGDDGSGPAERAGELAAEIATLFEAELVLVRAYENPPEPLGGRSPRDRRELDAALLRRREDLDGRAARLGAIARERPKTRLVETGSTPAVLSTARKRDEKPTLLAVGSRGPNAPGRALFVRVSTRSLRLADGPVLVVPPGCAPPRRPRNDARERRSRERRFPSRPLRSQKRPNTRRENDRSG